MTTEESNTLIANFMVGIQPHNTGPDEDNHNDDCWWFPEGDLCYLWDIKYHNSWDWLMRVVEKIESLHGAVTITKNDCEIHTFKDDNYDFMSNYNIEDDSKSTKEATYKAVIEFIEWYNKQQNNEKDMH